MQTKSLDRYVSDGRPKVAAALLISSKKTQKEIADQLGCSQSQISRIAAGRVRRASAIVRKICIELHKTSDYPGDRERVIGGALIEQAVGAVWDGSHAQAEALAHVITSLRALVSCADRHAP